VFLPLGGGDAHCREGDGIGVGALRLFVAEGGAAGKGGACDGGVKGGHFDVGLEGAKAGREVRFVGRVEAEDNSGAGGNGFCVRGSGSWNHDGLWLAGLSGQNPELAFEQAFLDRLL